jgi:hypothetical protein
MIEEQPPGCKMERPTERLVKIKFKFLTTGRHRGHRGSRSAFDTA